MSATGASSVPFRAGGLPSVPSAPPPPFASRRFRPVPRPPLPAGSFALLPVPVRSLLLSAVLLFPLSPHCNRQVQGRWDQPGHCLAAQGDRQRAHHTGVPLRPGSFIFSDTSDCPAPLQPAQGTVRLAVLKRPLGVEDKWSRASPWRTRPCARAAKALSPAPTGVAQAANGASMSHTNIGKALGCTQMRGSPSDHCDLDVARLASQLFEVSFVHSRYDRPPDEVGDSHDERVNSLLRAEAGTAEQLSSSHPDAYIDRVHFDALATQPGEDGSVPGAAPDNFRQHRGDGSHRELPPSHLCYERPHPVTSGCRTISEAGDRLAVKQEHRLQNAKAGFGHARSPSAQQTGRPTPMSPAAPAHGHVRAQPASHRPRPGASTSRGRQTPPCRRPQRRSARPPNDEALRVDRRPGLGSPSPWS